MKLVASLLKSGKNKDVSTIHFKKEVDPEKINAKMIVFVDVKRFVDQMRLFKSDFRVPKYVKGVFYINDKEYSKVLK